MTLSNDELGLRIELTSNVAEYLRHNRQKMPFAREAGGQLFGEIHSRIWTITTATGPRLADRRGRFSYVPDIKAEQAEIKMYESAGLIFMGDWHTHFQRLPRPSPNDLMASRECVRNSQSALPGFLLLVVGRSFPTVPCALLLITASEQYDLVEP